MTETKKGTGTPLWMMTYGDIRGKVLKAARIATDRAVNVVPRTIVRNDKLTDKDLLLGVAHTLRGVVGGERGCLTIICHAEWGKSDRGWLTAGRAPDHAKPMFGVSDENLCLREIDTSGAIHWLAHGDEKPLLAFVDDVTKWLIRPIYDRARLMLQDIVDNDGQATQFLGTRFAAQSDDLKALLVGYQSTLDFSHDGSVEWWVQVINHHRVSSHRKWKGKSSAVPEQVLIEGLLKNKHIFQAIASKIDAEEWL